MDRGEQLMAEKTLCIIKPDAVANNFVDQINEMIESALRRHNRRSTIISSVLGWILIGGYSFGLFQAVQNV